METIQTDRHKQQDDYIHKSNLWKFFKALRVQANPVYHLLVATPINDAWITIFDKADSTVQKRISILQFIHSLKKMPSAGKYYCLYINTYEIEKAYKQTFEATHLYELSLEIIIGLFPAIIAYRCSEAVNQGVRFELTPQTIQNYKFKSRYIEELKSIVEQCNHAILKQQSNSYL